MKIEIEVSEDCEATAMPWWLIINPRQNFKTDNDQGISNIAGMITGPFFSRKEAQNFLDATRYNFGKNAAVYCQSGTYSQQYREAIKAARGRLKEVPPLVRRPATAG